MANNCELCGWTADPVESPALVSVASGMIAMGQLGSYSVELHGHHREPAASASVPPPDSRTFGVLLGLFDQTRKRMVYLCGGCLVAKIVFDKPDAGVLADWLEQKGYTDAATALRAEFTPEKE